MERPLLERVGVFFCLKENREKKIEYREKKIEYRE